MIARVAILAGCALALGACAQPAGLQSVAAAEAAAIGRVQTISPTELAARIAAGEVLLVDVREPVEFAEGRIPGALNAPLSQFDPAMIPRETTRETIFYCRSDRRSQQAAEQMAERFGGTVLHLEGGFMAWEDAGLARIPQPAPAPPEAGDQTSD